MNQLIHLKSLRSGIEVRKLKKAINFYTIFKIIEQKY